MKANDVDARAAMWRRFDGDEWAAFDALPEAIRRRMQQHSYDPWAVNALMLWRMFRRKHASADRAIVTLRRYLDECERLDRETFATVHRSRYGTPLPHVTAGTSVLRYGRQGPCAAWPPGSDIGVSIPRSIASTSTAVGKLLPRPRDSKKVPLKCYQLDLWTDRLYDVRPN